MANWTYSEDDGSAPGERSAWSYFKDSVLSGALHNPIGAEGGARVILRRQGKSSEEINRAERKLSDKLAKRRQADNEAFAGRDADTLSPANIGKWTLDLLGNVIGGVDPTYVLGPGKTVATRVAAQAGINAGVDAGGQGIEIKRGVRDKYDPWQTVISGAGGAVIQGAGEAGRAIRTGRAVNRGSKMADWKDVNDVIVKDLEGGGTLAKPKVSPKGAMGPQQVMPETARKPGFGIRPWNGKTQEDLARVGRQYSAAMMDKYDGDVAKVLAAYNGGPGRVDKLIKKHGDDWLRHMPAESRNYVRKGLLKLGSSRYAGIQEKMDKGTSWKNISDEDRSFFTDYSKRDIENFLDEELEYDPTAPYAPPIDSYHEKFTPYAEARKADNDLGEPDVPDPLEGYRFYNEMILHPDNRDAFPEELRSIFDKINGDTFREGQAPTQKEAMLLERWWVENADNMPVRQDNIKPPKAPMTDEELTKYEADWRRDHADFDDIDMEGLPVTRDEFADMPPYAREELLATKATDVKAPAAPMAPPRPDDMLAAKRWENAGNVSKTKQFGGDGKYAGSVNLDRMKISKAAKDILRSFSRDASVSHQAHEDTKMFAEQMIDRYGVEGLLGRKEMPIEEIPAYNTAVRAIDAAAAKRVATLAKDVLDETKSTPSIRNQFEEARLLSAAAYERANNISGLAGRILDAQNIIVGKGALSKSINKLVQQMVGNTLDTVDIARLVAKHEDMVNKIMSDSLKPKAEDYFSSLWYNWRLSGLTTQVANIVGTVSHIAMDMATRMASIPLDALVSKGQGTNAGEMAARAYGLWIGAKQAFSHMEGGKASPFKMAFDIGTPLDLRGRVDTGRVFQGKAGFLEFPTRSMAAFDEFFRNVAVMSDLHGHAFRIAHREGLTGADLRARIEELSNNPTREMEDSAIEYGRRMRFADDASGITKKVEGLRHSKKTDDYMTRGLALGVRMILPFVHTLDRLTAAAFRHTPIGFVDRVNREAWKKGGSEASMATTRMAMGTLMIMGAAMKAAQGGITGAGPSDYRKLEELQATGWRPYSVKIGDKYISIRTLQPFSTLLGATATAVEQWQTEGNDKSWADTTARLIKAAGGAALSGSWTESLASAMQTTDPKSNAKLANFVASIFDPSPTILRQINQGYVDTRERDTTGDGSFLDRVKGRMQASIPGLSDNMPEKIDAYGRPVEREGAIGPDIASPLKVSTEVKDKVTTELSRLSGKSKSALVNPPRKKVTVNGFETELNSEEYQQYRYLSGHYFMNEMGERVDSEAWQSLSDIDKKADVKKVLEGARKRARTELFSPPETPASEEASNWSFSE